MFGSLTNLEGSLFDEFRRLERQLNDAFGYGTTVPGIRSVVQGTYPPINVGVTAETVDVYLFSAGIDPGELDVSIQQNLLTVAGNRKPHEEREGARFYRQERFSGNFRRVITLPDDVDPDRVEAKYQDGVLHIKVHRREVSKPKQIHIK